MFSFLKILGRILLGILLIGVLLALFGYIGNHAQSLKHSILGGSTQPGGAPSVTIGNIEIPVEVAKDPETMQKGLSGRASLGQNSGMLFVFSQPSIYRFWMPDMHFPIDIFWINNGQIIGIEENASPDFDRNNPHYYTPPAPIQFTLETNAGFARKNNIRVGDQISLNDIK